MKLSPRSSRVSIYVAVAVFAVVMVVLPLYLPQYQVLLISLVMIYATIGYGLNLLTGFAGRVSLGHTFFFAVGAYASTIFEADLGWSEPLAGAAAIALSALLGWLMGRPILRFRGLQLALATLALAVLTPLLIRRFSDLTGGEDGRPTPPLTFLDGTGLATDQRGYYLALIVIAIAIVIYLWSCRPLVRMALLVTAEQPVVAQTLGVNTTSLSTQVFTVSAGMAGAAGFVFVKVLGYVGAESFGFMVAVSFLAMIVIGGSRSVVGPWLGAAFIVIVPSVASDVSTAAPSALYGLFLLLAVFLLPVGIGGAAELGIRRLFRGADGQVDAAEADRRSSVSLH
ncbi:hypothetical protein GCM10009775_07330 [Microbacterium aoyamense]|uniref:Branched-chain amino acid ABC transporter permease n=1 Tax=Microbacterium aoyamense TaxID=344166 RepID=A0ABN2PBU4_9MICO|nr:branched-chain amino acid ABC transporter permease [Microbacterium aoyamense]